MTRLRGWASRGERLVDKVPQGKRKTATSSSPPCATTASDVALPVRRAHQRRALPRLCRTVPRADAGSYRRRRDPRQSRGSHKGKAVADETIRNVGARLVFFAEILPRPQPHRAGHSRQVQNSAAKGGSVELYDGDLRRRRQNPFSPRYPPAECAEYLKNAGYA